MSINYFGSRRHKPFWIGLVRTVPFMSAGILSFILFYSQDTVTPDWDRDAILVLIFAFLSATVFITVSQQLPYSKKNIIDDLLDATRYQLGKHYRINLMILITGNGSAYFKITHGSGYEDKSKYKKQLDMGIPGASEAWGNVGPFYHPKTELRESVDPEVKHLWSVGVKGRQGKIVAVLNVDNIKDDKILDNTINHIKDSSIQLADIIAYYWEIPG